MSRLSEEQKAINKAAVMARNKAFSERGGAYRKELKQTEQALASHPAKVAWEAKAKVVDQLVVERNDAVAVVLEEIEALKAKIVSINDSYQVKLVSAKTERDEAGKAFRGVEYALRDEVDQRYPDMVGVFSVGQWKPLEDFLLEGEVESDAERPRG